MMLRRFLQFPLFVLVAALPLSARAALARTIGPAEIVAVQSLRVTDLVLLGGGFDAGLREGMVCRVTRDGTEIAEVLLVGLRPACSAALILQLAPRQSVRAGDVVSVKTIKI